MRCDACRMTPSNDPANEAGHEWLDHWQRRNWPPANEIPGLLPLREVLGRSDSVIVVLRDMHVYSNGVSINVVARGRPGHHPSFLTMPPLIAERMGLPTPTCSPMRLQVIFEDGTEATALGTEDLRQRLDEVADQPVLRDTRGSGNPDAMDYPYWLTPAPTRAVTIKFAWPEQGLPAIELNIDQAALRRASQEAMELWPALTTGHAY